MALLDEVRGGLGERYLIRGRYVVKVGVLHQRVEPVVTHRSVGIAEDGLGVAAGKEVAQRARAVGVVQLAHEAGAFVQLVLQGVPEQPRLAVGGGVVELLGVVRPVLDTAGELQAPGAEGDPDAGGFAVRLRARGKVFEGADVGVCPDVEAVRRREVDAGGVGQAIGRVAVAVAAFHVHAGAVGKPRLDAGDQVALAAPGGAQHGLGSLVVHGVVEVEAGALRVHVVGAQLATGAEIAGRELGVDGHLLRYSPLAADAYASVVWPVTVGRDRVLHEAVGLPAPERVVANLHDRIDALTLILGRRHDG